MEPTDFEGRRGVILRLTSYEVAKELKVVIVKFWNPRIEIPNYASGYKNEQAN